MPIDKEKKACPRAESTPCEVSSENLGKKRNFIPSMAPSSVHARIPSIKISTKRRGIMSLVYRSIPFFTPASTINPVRAMNTICQNTGL